MGLDCRKYISCFIAPWLSFFRAGAPVILILSLILICIASNLGLLVVEQNIDPTEISTNGGDQWVDYHVDTPLRAWGFLVTGCDFIAGTAQGYFGAEMTIYEDGRPLGPSHSLFNTIRDNGSGAYSYQCTAPPWTRSLLFSTSDNSDPRSNNHTYSVRYPVRLPPCTVVILLVFSAILSLVTIKDKIARLWIMSVWICMVSISIWALFRWISQPVTINYMEDSFGYLYPALSYISGNQFSPTQGRSFVYPGFILIILSVFRNVHALVYAQTVIYVIIAIIVAIIPVAATIGRIPQQPIRILQAYLGAISLFVFLHYTPLAYSVHALLPEILCTGTISVVYILLVIVFRVPGNIFILLLSGVGLYLTVATFYIKPSWGAAMIFSGLLFILRIICTINSTVFIRIAVLLICCTLIMITLVGYNRYLSTTYDSYESTIFGPETLFCNNMPIIIESLDQRMANIEPATDRHFINDLRNNMVYTVARGLNNWNVLGYNGDLCMYHQDVLGPIIRHFDNDPIRISHFLLVTFWHSILDRPFSFFNRVIKQIVVAIYRPFGDADFKQFSFNDKVLESNLSWFSKNAPEFIVNRAQFSGTIEAPLGFETGISAIRILQETFWGICLLGCFMFICDIGLSVHNLRQLMILRVIQLWTPAILSMGLLLSATIVVSISHTFDIGRYSWILAPLVLGALSTLIIAIIESTCFRFKLIVIYPIKATYRRIAPCSSASNGIYTAVRSARE